MEAIVYKTTGKEAGKVKLPKEMFALPWNSDLVYQVVNSMRSSARQPIAHTKTRGEVSGTGKKPWQQKGTGRARHGSMRSPIWVGGGIAHGPRNDQNFDRKINKKLKSKAFFIILSKKFADGEIIFLDDASMKEVKTKDAKASLVALSKVKGFEKLVTKKQNTAIVALSTKNDAVEKSFRNIGSVVVDEARNLSPLDLLGHTFVVFENPEKALEILKTKLAK
jgi:large subunit ribosomal protein L4